MDNPTEVLQEPFPQQPWERPDLFDEKPAGESYGFKAGKKMKGCTREDLISRCSRDEVPPIHLVWTPDTSRLVPPAEVPFLCEAVATRAGRRGKQTLLVGLFHVAIWGFLSWASLYNSKKTPVSYFLIFNAVFLGLLPAINGFNLIRASKRLSADAIARDSKLVRYSIWLSTTRVVWTYALAALIALVGLMQLKVGLVKSVEAAGLVKDFVRRGQFWRLLTCTMLHVNIIHFVFNMMALLNLGRPIEVLISGGCVPLVFLFSGLVGSIASTLLLPGTTSVGASGGLLGMIGFLIVLGYRRKRALPVGFLKSIWTSVLWIALMGVVAFDYIDNAAHAGGFLAGVTLGMVCIGPGQSVPVVPPKGTWISAWASLIGIFSVAGICIWKML